ncbi:MAG: hypothetical protein HZA90_07150 [Verrucomicrobia bacterium]|nr:hypothetical protein [Verrucomicrobiota bacterium]
MPTPNPISQHIDEHKKAAQELARLDKLETQYKQEESELLRTTDPEDAEKMKLLGAVRLRLACIPGRREQWEKRLAEVEDGIHQEMRRQISLVNDYLRNQRDTTLSRVAEVLQPFCSTPEAARQVANQTDVVKDADRASGYYTLDFPSYRQRDGTIFPAAVEFLAFASKWGFVLQEPSPAQ